MSYADPSIATELTGRARRRRLMRKRFLRRPFAVIGLIIAVGFIVSFVVAIVVVKGFVHYISRHGFAPFAWYRIVAGATALVWLTMR